MKTVELVNTIQGYKKTKWEIPFTQHERPEDRLDGFLYQTGPQATGADFNALGCTFH